MKYSELILGTTYLVQRQQTKNRLGSIDEITVVCKSANATKVRGICAENWYLNEWEIDVVDTLKKEPFRESLQTSIK